MLLFRFQGAFSRGENEFIIKLEICCLEEKRFILELKGADSEKRRIYHGAEKNADSEKSGFFTELKGADSEKRRIFHRVEKALLGGKADLSRSRKGAARRKGGFITERKGVASEEKRIFRKVERR